MSQPRPPKIVLVTPSYYRDFERCKLLCESVERFVDAKVDHYVMVAERDEKLFAPLRSKRVHVMRQEDVLPWWLFQIERNPKWWLSLKSPPLRGWLIQQLVKLAVDGIVDADAYVFVDSGCVFVRPFDPSFYVRDGKVLLFREQGPQFRVETNRKWHKIAADVLGLPVQKEYDTSYVGSLVSFSRRNIVKFHEHIEKRTGRGWMESLAWKTTFSEYVLHGVFCEQVLKDDAQVFFDDSILVFSHWGLEKLDEEDMRALKRELLPEHHVVMLNEKSGTPIDVIRKVLVHEG